MHRRPDTEPLSEPVAPSHASLSLRNGLSGTFLDFDLLSDLLARAERTITRGETTADWADWLSEVGFDHRHVDPDELPAGMSVADSIAADAWRFAQRMGFIDSDGLTDAGRKVAALEDLDTDHRKVELAPVLAGRVDERLLGEGDAPILPLLLQAARYLAETTNLWAQECPRLIPTEVGVIVHWASIDLMRANDLVKKIVTWRDTAMHRYPAPDPAHPIGTHAEFHADKVSEFYAEHAWLGERVALSFGHELALYRLLRYCGLLDPGGDAVVGLEQRRFLRLKNEMIKGLKESIEFFSVEKKWDREKMVVETLLERLGIDFDASELSEPEEPADVAFRDARFQVKEVMQFHGEEIRRRHDEYKAALRRVEAAETMEELMRLTPFREVTWDRIVTESVKAAKKHIGRYGVKERRDLDVVCYYNRHDHFEVDAPTPDYKKLDCRSFSIVSNSYARVLFADSSAAKFLQEAVGARHAGQFD